MRYCKLINNELHDVRFPIGENKDIYTNDETILRQYGYKPVVYAEQPEIEENEYLTPVYTETENTIDIAWEIHEDDDATEADYLSALAELGVNTDEET